MPLVTVLMSVFNGEKFLRQAIDSVLTQTLDDFEFIVIDDGSTDKSLDIVASYSDQRIRLIQNEKNIGLTPSLNKGLRFARGKYIARIDCDDISHPKRLETQVTFLNNNPDVGICGTWAKIIGRWKSRVWECPVQMDEIQCYFPFKNPICHSSVMMQREKLKCHRLEYDENYHYAQDLDLWVRSASHFQIQNLPIPLVQYRIHNGSIGHTCRVAQKEAASRVYWRMLQSSQLLPTAQALEAHQWINRWPRVATREAVEQVEHWLQQLRDADAQKNVFPQIYFRKVLGYLWFRECLSASKLGRWVWRQFTGSRLFADVAVTRLALLELWLKTRQAR